MYREHIAIFVLTAASGGGARRLVLAQSIRARAQSILWSAPSFSPLPQDIGGIASASGSSGVEVLFYCTATAVHAAVSGAGIPPLEIATRDISHAAALDANDGSQPQV